MTAPLSSPGPGAPRGQTCVLLTISPAPAVGLALSDSYLWDLCGR